MKRNFSIKLLILTLISLTILAKKVENNKKQDIGLIPRATHVLAEAGVSFLYITNN